MTAELATVARNLIRTNGRQVRLVKTTDQPADPTKPWRGSNTVDQQLDVWAVFEEKIESEFAKALSQTSTNNPRRLRTRFYVAALDVGSFPIDEGDQVQDGNDRYRIETIELVQPASIPIMYTLEVAS